jgi:hypothetical protein
VTAVDSALVIVNTASAVVQLLPYVFGATLLLVGLNFAGVPETVVLGSVAGVVGTATMANDAAAVEAVDACTAPPETNNPAVAIAVMTAARLAVVSMELPPVSTPARRHDGGGSQRRVQHVEQCAARHGPFARAETHQWPCAARVRATAGRAPREGPSQRGRTRRPAGRPSVSEAGA